MGANKGRQEASLGRLESGGGSSTGDVKNGSDAALRKDARAEPSAATGGNASLMTIG
jgi:hypothetical protein